MAAAESGGGEHSQVGVNLAPPEIVLASTSVYRRAQVERLGVRFRSRAPLCDEESLKRLESEPRLLAESLALAKAMSLVGDEPGATIIGSDQLVAFGGRVFGKPGTIAAAVGQLELMAGETHELITAVVVVRGEQSFGHTDVTRLKMRPLSRAAIERYVAADMPIDCAGSYKLESRGLALFEAIESADHSAVTGLPLIALVTILNKLGFEIP